MRDRYSGKSRGFGFVTFMASQDAQHVASMDHVVDGRRYVHGPLSSPVQGVMGYLLGNTPSRGQPAAAAAHLQACRPQGTEACWRYTAESHMTSRASHHVAGLRHACHCPDLRLHSQASGPDIWASEGAAEIEDLRRTCACCRCDAKLALPRGTTSSTPSATSPLAPGSTHRIFVARIPPTVTDPEFKSYWETFGPVQVGHPVLLEHWEFVTACTALPLRAGPLRCAWQRRSSLKLRWETPGRSCHSPWIPAIASTSLAKYRHWVQTGQPAAEACS